MKNNKFKIYGALAFALTASVTLAQPANEFFLESLPQSSYLNPGKTHQETFHMNFPALFMAGQTTVNGSLPGFSFSDIASSVDTTTTIGLAGMLPFLKDNNYMNINFQKEFLTYGWIKGKNYWSFNVGLTFNVDVNFSDDFMGLLVEGPGASLLPDATGTPGEPISLDGSRYNVTVFQEYGIGFSRNVNEKLRLGGRLRFLSGAMNFNGSLDGVNITTAADLTSLTIESAIKAQSATPLAYDDVVDANGDTTSTLNGEETQANFTSALTGFKNAGVAIDFGGSYKVNDKITAFGSVRDFGMIKWNSGNTFANKENTSFVFEGFSSAQLQDSTFMENFGDSITDILKLEKTEEAYTTYLPTRFFIGGEYQLNSQLSANLLYSGKIANSKLNNTIVAGFGWMPSKWFETRLSYTMKNGTNDNVGLATVLSLGAWQLYFITDNIIGLTAIDYAKEVNFSFGSNLTFGRKKYFAEKKDAKNGVKSTGDEAVKSDSTKSTVTPKKAKDAKKVGDKKASDAKEEVKEDKKAAKKKVDSAKDDAENDKKDAKDEVKAAEKSERKAETKAEADAKKVEKRANKAIDAAEDKMDEADAKVKAAENKVKSAENKVKAVQEEAAATKQSVTAKVVTPAPVTSIAVKQDSTSSSASDSISNAVSDSLTMPAVPKLPIDSLLIKPTASGASKVVPATSTGASTAVKIDATAKEVKANIGVDALDKTIEVINQVGENKGNDVPTDIK